MPKFKKNLNPIMKKQAYGIAKSPFTMKVYSYPGVSPVKQDFIKRTKKEFKPLLKEGMKESEKIFSKAYSKGGSTPKFMQPVMIKSHGYERGLVKLAKHKISKLIKRIKD